MTSSSSGETGEDQRRWVKRGGGVHQLRRNRDYIRKRTAEEMRQPADRSTWSHMLIWITLMAFSSSMFTVGQHKGLDSTEQYGWRWSFICMASTRRCSRDKSSPVRRCTHRQASHHHQQSEQRSEGWCDEVMLDLYRGSFQKIKTHTDTAQFLTYTSRSLPKTLNRNINERKRSEENSENNLWLLNIQKSGFQVKEFLHELLLAHEPNSLKN